VGRAVAALAADPDVAQKSGRVFSSWGLAKEYGLDDVDGRRPDIGQYFNEQFGTMAKPCDDEFYSYWAGGPMEALYADWPFP